MMMDLLTFNELRLLPKKKTYFLHFLLLTIFIYTLSA